MNSLKEEMLRMVGRNKLVGIWAAEKLGLSRSSFYRRLKELGLG